MVSTNRALGLLATWEEYKSLHYSQQTRFDRAIDIEIEKDALSNLARQIKEALLTGNEPDLEYLAISFEHHLTIVRDMLMIEILRTGVSDKI